MKRITRSPESIPFFPPPDNVTPKIMYLGTREIPKIDGSQGAFIGVVVSLSVLIVVCCAAVFYLLRHHEPTDQERAARRERYQRSREQTLNSASAFSGPSTLGSGSLGDKVKQIWQSTTGRGQGGGGRRGGRGWIRAGSDDGWASRRSDRAGGGAGHDPEGGDRLRSLPVLGKDTRGAGTAADGVRVVESPLSDAGSGFGPGKYGYMYTDPFAKTGSDAALQRSQSPLSSSSSPISSPRGSASADESREAHSPRDNSRHRSAMSNGSTWTHGSKFVEDI